MSVSHDNLVARFADLADDFLLERVRSGALTDDAREVAEQELRSRGIEFDKPAAPVSASGEASDDGQIDGTSIDTGANGDLTNLVRNLMPTEAHILQARLEAEDVYTVVADANLGQVNWALPAAAGGARVLVADRDMEKAKLVLAQLQRGDYRLDEKDEVQVCPRCASTKLTTFIPGFLVSVFKYSGPSQRLLCEACGHTWPNSTSSI